MESQLIRDQTVLGGSERLVRSLQIDFRGTPLSAALTLPLNAGGLVLLVHASARGHLAPQSQFLTQALTQRSIAVLQLDLLTEREEAKDIISPRFENDPDALTGRLIAAADWVVSQPYLQHLCVGSFGFGPAGIAVLSAAAVLNQFIAAVVVCDAQPTLAAGKLSGILAPTLLIASESDRRLEELAFRQLRCEKELEILPDNGALGTAERVKAVADLARDWFTQHLDRALALKAAGLKL